MTLEIIIFVIGVLYGYLKPGKQSKMELFKKGMLIGVVLGVIFGILSILTATGTFIGVLLAVILLALFFIAGVAVGDLMESWTR